MESVSIIAKVKEKLGQLRRSLPETYFLFPLDGENSSEAKSKKKQKGISLLIAILAIALLFGLLTDMLVSSTVEMQIATSVRDEIKAEYLAKSGFNLSVFIITLDWGIALLRAQPSTPAPFGGQPLADNEQGIWNSLSQLPPVGAASVKFLSGMAKSEEDPFGLKGIFSEKISKTMALFEDQFTISVQDEGAKINVNDCLQGRCESTISKLLALFNCPAEKMFLESKNVKAEELAYRIKDFISKSGQSSDQSGFSDKNTPYRDFVPKFEAKSLPFDSVDELKLVAGWDDQIHSVFAPYLTVYPISSKTTKPSLINLNTVKQELLSCLVPDAMEQSCRDKFLLSFSKKKANKDDIAGKDAAAGMADLTCMKDNPALKDYEKPGPWFTNRSSVFRVVVQADTGDQRKRLEAVLRRIMPKDADNQRSKQSVKRSYELLYYKMH